MNLTVPLDVVKSAVARYKNWGMLRCDWWRQAIEPGEGESAGETPAFTE
jgi:hypothetical protein